MVLLVKVITRNEPLAFAVFDIEMKDGSVVRTCGVFERVEKVEAMYQHWDSRELKPFYEIANVIYDGSECIPNPKTKNSYLYQFHTKIDNVCKIKKHAKLIVLYEDGSREEICGRYAGITFYYVYYKLCVDIDPENIRYVRLVSMAFRPCAE
jgi:hypothetical protein